MVALPREGLTGVHRCGAECGERRWTKQLRTDQRWPQAPLLPGCLPFQVLRRWRVCGEENMATSAHKRQRISWVTATIPGVTLTVGWRWGVAPGPSRAAVNISTHRMAGWGRGGGRHIDPWVLRHKRNTERLRITSFREWLMEVCTRDDCVISLICIWPGRL